jgi:hypothetical protein
MIGYAAISFLSRVIPVSLPRTNLPDSWVWVLQLLEYSTPHGGGVRDPTFPRDYGIESLVV